MQLSSLLHWFLALLLAVNITGCGEPAENKPPKIQRPALRL